MRYSFDTIYSECAAMVTASGSSTSISLVDDVSWYQLRAAVNTTVNFSLTNLSRANLERPVIMFYLKLDMPSTVTTVSWPSSVKWLNDMTPIMNAGGKSYLLLFCSFDMGANWVASKVGSFTTPTSS